MNTNTFVPSFVDDTHRQRFLAAIQKIGKVYAGKIDQEYGATLYILTADAFAWEQARRYVDRDGIDIQAILDKLAFSSSESALTRLAGNLFNGNVHIDPVELMCLDEQNFQLAIDAIHLRWHGMLLSELHRPQ